MHMSASLSVAGRASVQRITLTFSAARNALSPGGPATISAVTARAANAHKRKSLRSWTRQRSENHADVQRRTQRSEPWRAQLRLVPLRHGPRMHMSAGLRSWTRQRSENHADVQRRTQRSEPWRAQLRLVPLRHGPRMHISASLSVAGRASVQRISLTFSTARNALSPGGPSYV